MVRITTFAMAGLDAWTSEDAVWQEGDDTSGFALVLDGVTSPQPAITGCEHGVRWFVRTLRDSIVAALKPVELLQPNVTYLRSALRDAITATADRHSGQCDLTQMMTPQATMALAVWDETVLCFAVLCDSYAVVKDVRGSCAVHTDPALTLTSLAPDYGVRRYRNISGGFHTLAADPSVIGFLRTWTIPRAFTRGFVLTTDGAARYVLEYHLGSWDEFYRNVQTDPRDVVLPLRELELQRQPQEDRKRSDDIAIASVDFDTGAG